MKQIPLLFLLLGLFRPAGYAQPLTLEQAIDSALRNAYSVQLAGYGLQLAGEKMQEARAGSKPRLFAATDYRYYTNLPYQLLPAGVFGGPADTYKEARFGVPHTINANIQASYPLYNPVATSAIQTARAARDLSAAQLTRSREDIVLEVSNLYYNAQIIYSQIGFLDSNLANSRQLLSLMSLLHEQRLARGSDVDKVRLQLSQLDWQRESASVQYRQAMHLLQFLMGTDPADSIQLLGVPEELPAINLELKPMAEMQVTSSQLHLLEREISAIKKSWLPSIQLNGLYGTTGFGKTGSNDFLKFYPLGYVGLQLSVPIYSGNAVKSRIRSKTLEVDKTRLQLRMLEDKNEVDRINNQYQLQLAARNLPVIRQQIRLAQSIYDKTLLQQKEGLASLTDILLADTDLRDAQKNYINALVALRKAELEYKKITGNLLKPQS